MSGLSRNRERVLAALALGAVLAAGAALRLDNLRIWNEHPGRFFHAGKPLLMSVDGYYYLGLAQALLEGDYQPIDPNRAAPLGKPRPQPPPLLSALTALAVKWGGASLEWVGVLLPPLLAVLLALPVYALGRHFGGRAMGLCAALLAVCSPFYVDRTIAGWYDTDCLNVTLALAMPYFLLRFSVTPTRRRYLHLGAALLTYAAFLCWWDQGRAPASFALAIPLAVALVFTPQRRRRDDRLLWGALVLVALSVLALYGRELVEAAWGALRYVTKAQVNPFPAAGSNVIEQRPEDLARLAARATGSSWGGIVAALGLGLLAWRHRAQSLFLLFPLLVSLLALEAVRFVLFLAPLVGLGVAAAVLELWRLPRGGALARVAALLLLASVVWPVATRLDRDNFLAPRRFPFQVAAMTAIGERTPPDAVIWTDWAHGYPLQYYAGRGTLGDGSYHSDRLMYLLSVPLAVRDFRTAANWIGFFVAHGTPGLTRARDRLDASWSETTEALKRIFGAGPERAAPILAEFGVVEPAELEQWLIFLFPPERRPAYVFVELHKIKTPWFYYGTWDFESLSGSAFAHVPFVGLEVASGRVRSDEIDIDLASGEARYDGRLFWLARFEPKGARKSEGTLALRDYGRSGYAFLIDEAAGFGILIDDESAQSVGHHLFVNASVDLRYFRPVLSRYPLYQLWEVRSDSLR
jgi:hypothetical protein